jgi:hypothetical protein
MGYRVDSYSTAQNYSIHVHQTEHVQNTHTIKFEVLTGVATKNKDFWVVTPCNLETAKIFGGIYHLHLQAAS